MAKNSPAIVEGTAELAPLQSYSDPSALAELEQILLTGETNVEVIDDPAEISVQILARYLAAESDEDLGQKEATPWGDLLDVPVEVRGFRWQRSAFEGMGSPIYFIVSAVNLETGEPLVLTTGSMNALAQLTNLAKRGRLPGAVVRLVKSAKATRAGFYPLWLEILGNTADTEGEPAAA